MTGAWDLAAAVAGGLGEWQTAIVLAFDQVTPVDQLGADWGSLLARADVLQYTCLLTGCMHTWGSFSNTTKHLSHYVQLCCSVTTVYVNVHVLSMSKVNDQQ